MIIEVQKQNGLYRLFSNRIGFFAINKLNYELSTILPGKTSV